MVEGLAIIKRRRSKGSIAKSLTIEIVLVVFALFSDNVRAFLIMCQRVRDLPSAGHPRCRPASRGPACGPPSARARALRHVGRVGPKAV